MHVYLPTIIAGVQKHHGCTIDLMGDGVMALFGGKHTDRAMSMCVKDAGLCGESLLQVRESIINDILRADGIEAVDFGVGIDYGKVIVTKIGFGVSWSSKIVTLVSHKLTMRISPETG